MTLNGPLKRHSSLKVHVAPSFAFRMKATAVWRAQSTVCTLCHRTGAYDARAQSGERVENHQRRRAVHERTRAGRAGGGQMSNLRLFAKLRKNIALRTRLRANLIADWVKLLIGPTDLFVTTLHACLRTFRRILKLSLWSRHADMQRSELCDVCRSRSQHLSVSLSSAKTRAFLTS